MYSRSMSLVYAYLGRLILCRHRWGCLASGTYHSGILGPSVPDCRTGLRGAHVPLYLWASYGTAQPATGATGATVSGVQACSVNQCLHPWRCLGGNDQALSRGRPSETLPPPPPPFLFPHTDSPPTPLPKGRQFCHKSRLSSNCLSATTHRAPEPTKREHMVRAVAQCHDSSIRHKRHKQRRVCRPPRSSICSISSLALALAGFRPRCLASSTTTSRATVAYQPSHTHTSPRPQPMSSTCRRQLPLELYR